MLDDDSAADARARIVALELLVCEMLRRLVAGSGDAAAEMDGIRRRIDRENRLFLTVAPAEMVSEHLDRLMDQAQAMDRP